MTYTTSDLIQLLTGELDACMQGERLKLSAITTGFAKEADALLAEKGIQQIAAYHDFRTEIWKYQLLYSVSGIVWEEIEVNGKLFRFPAIDDQLISLPSDLELMHSYKEQVVEFWREITQGLQIWRSGSNVNGQETPNMVISLKEASVLIQQCEWATLSADHFDRQICRWKLDNDPDCQEINLELGWGAPEMAGYWENLPEHGSEWLTAVNPHATEPEE